MSALKDHIRQAIQHEKRAYDLYRLVSAATTDGERRKLTQRLADDAVRHLAIIERACRAKSPSLSTFFQHYVPEVEFAAGDEDELVEALRSAVESKRRLIELYTTLSTQIAEPEWGEVFHNLVEAEQAHLEFVRTRLPSVA
jgi:rubrerythrin